MTNLDSLHTNIKIGRSKPFRPSKISTLFDCPWHYLLSTEQSKLPTLESNPLGLLGSAMHKIIEDNAGQHSLKGLEVQNLIVSEFEKKVSSQPDNLLKWAYERLGITGVISQQRLLNASQLAFKSIRSSPPKKISNEFSNINFDSKLNNFVRERKFYSPKLGLEGWPDLVYTNENLIHVVDYKLSLRRNEEGKPKEAYIVQAAAYGLLAKETYKNSNVILELISPSDKWIKHLDADLENQVKDLLIHANQILPIGEKFDAQEIARPGMHCEQCSYRPACLTYNDSLIKDNIKSSESICTHDVYGKITAIEESNNLFRLEIKSNVESRKIIVDGFVSKNNLKPLVHANFLGYELGSAEVKGRGSYISNFHLFNPANSINSAFSSYVNIV